MSAWIFNFMIIVAGTHSHPVLTVDWEEGGEQGMGEVYKTPTKACRNNIKQLDKSDHSATLFFQPEEP